MGNIQTEIEGQFVSLSHFRYKVKKEKKDIKSNFEEYSENVTYSYFQNIKSLFEISHFEKYNQIVTLSHRIKSNLKGQV